MTILILHGAELNSSSSDANFINNLIKGPNFSLFNNLRINRVWFADQPKSFLKRGINKVLTKNKLLNLLRLQLYSKFYVYRNKSAIEQIIRKKDIRKIWICLTSAELIVLSHLLLNELKGVTLYVSILDEFDYMFKDNIKLNTVTYVSLFKKFNEIITNCGAISVVTNNMGKELLKKNFISNIPKKFTILRTPGSSNRIVNNLKINKLKKMTIKVAFAGNLYAKDEWNQFINTMRNFEDNTSIPVEVHFFGKEPYGVEAGKNVVYHGYLEQNVLNVRLLKCHFAYLPYPSVNKVSNVAYTSFPSKLSNYLELGLPVIYHGPARTAVENFILKNDIGLKFDVTRSFFDDLCCEQSYETKRTNAIKVYNKQLSIDAQQENLKIFLDIKFNDIIKIN